MVYLFLADGFEEIEALTPLDYLRRCEGVDIKTVGLNADNIITSVHDIKVIADMNIEQINMKTLGEIDMIIFPGGKLGTTNLENNQKVQDILTYCYDENKIIGAICAAPTILGHRQMLKGKKATCYKGFESELAQANYTGEPVEVSENIITARGAGVSNQFAFALIEKLIGKEKAEQIKTAVLY